MGESLDPPALSRLWQALRPDWMRTVAARRAAAGGLVVLAGLAALRDNPDGDLTDVVIASRDLTPGTSLTVDDVHVEKRLSATVPEGAPREVESVLGSTLASPARRGEVITDLRLLGPRLADSAVGRDARIVPLNLPDTALLDIIRTGDVVDVLAARQSGVGTGSDGDARVVATGAVVVLISPKPSQGGAGNERVVLVALPAATAHTVAGVALVETITLTFH